MKKFKLVIMESERGWGQSFWDEYFDTRAEAEARKFSMNSQNPERINGRAPDYYIQAMDIYEYKESYVKC